MIVQSSDVDVNTNSLLRDHLVTEGVALSTVVGSKHYGREYTPICIKSWSRVVGLDSEMHIISDDLEPSDMDDARSRGFEIHEKNSDQVLEAIRTSPGLQAMRQRSPTWRHVIDSVVLLRHARRLVLIDTDVFVVEPIAFEVDGPDFVYNVDDIPGFRGSWYLPLTEAIVPAINPGFLVLRPSALDLERLEELVQRYFVRARNPWWTRQSALAIVIGEAKSRGVFDGEDVRVFSGHKKRSAEEIRQNKWKYWGNSAFVTATDWAERCIDGAAVLHLAGAGKKWLHLATARVRDGGEPRLLRALEATNATFVERVVISMRMLALQSGWNEVRAKRRRRKMRNHT